MHPTIRSDATLPDVLAERARGASDMRLSLDVAGGVLAAAAALYWRPAAWPIALSAALCFASFGLWGIADRAYTAAPDVRRRGAQTLRAARGAAAALGILSGVALAVSIAALGFGHWQS